MQRIEYTQFGEPPDVLRLGEDEVPAPAAGQVRVQVEAAPINPSDLLTVRGGYGILPDHFPAVPGNEGVGRIAEIGDDVTTVAVDDLVILPLGSGTWRTAMTIDAAGLFPLPDTVDPLQLAMLSINPMSAYLLLTEIVALEPGDWVVLNAANSALGHYLVALAHRRGIHTAAIVRRDGGIARDLKETGATAVVVDQGQDVAADVDAQTGGSPVKLAVDAVGGPATNVLADCLADGGTIAVYGALSGQACQLAPQAAVFRDIRLVGFWVAKWLETAPTETVKARYGELLELMREGRLKAEVAGTYPLDHFRDAIREASHGGRAGKILFTPDGPSW